CIHPDPVARRPNLTARQATAPGEAAQLVYTTIPDSNQIQRDANRNSPLMARNSLYDGNKKRVSLNREYPTGKECHESMD
ncbi:hypothetical protein ACFVWE_31810, partial [Streptomyces albidoflavus]